MSVLWCLERTWSLGKWPELDAAIHGLGILVGRLSEIMDNLTKIGVHTLHSRKSPISSTTLDVITETDSRNERAGKAGLE